MLAGGWPPNDKLLAPHGTDAAAAGCHARPAHRGDLQRRRQAIWRRVARLDEKNLHDLMPAPHTTMIPAAQHDACERRQRSAAVRSRRPRSAATAAAYVALFRGLCECRRARVSRGAHGDGAETSLVVDARSHLAASWSVRRPGRVQTSKTRCQKVLWGSHMTIDLGHRRREIGGGQPKWAQVVVGGPRASGEQWNMLDAQ